MGSRKVINVLFVWVYQCCVDEDNPLSALHTSQLKSNRLFLKTTNLDFKFLLTIYLRKHVKNPSKSSTYSLCKYFLFLWLILYKNYQIKLSPNIELGFVNLLNFMLTERIKLKCFYEYFNICNAYILIFVKHYTCITYNTNWKTLNVKTWWWVIRIGLFFRDRNPSLNMCLAYAFTFLNVLGSLFFIQIENLIHV